MADRDSASSSASASAATPSLLPTLSPLTVAAVSEWCTTHSSEFDALVAEKASQNAIESWHAKHDDAARRASQAVWRRVMATGDAVARKMSGAATKTGFTTGIRNTSTTTTSSGSSSSNDATTGKKRPTTTVTSTTTTTKVFTKTAMNAMEKKKYTDERALSCRKRLLGLGKDDFIVQLLADVGKDLDICSLVSVIKSNISVLFGSGHVQVYILDETGGVLMAGGGGGGNQPQQMKQQVTDIDDMLLPMGTGIAGYVAETGETVRAGPEIVRDKRYRAERDAEYERRTVSLLCMPILLNQRVIGVAQVVNKDVDSSNTFDGEDENILGTYLHFCALAMANAKVFEQAVLDCRSSEVLLELAKHVFTDLSSVGGVVQGIIKRAARLLQCDRCSIFEVDETSNELLARVFEDGEVSGSSNIGGGGGGGASSSEDKQQQKEEAKSANDDTPSPTRISVGEIRFPRSTGVAGHVATTGETLNIPDAYADSRFNRDVDAKTGYVTRNLLCMPIRAANGDIVGVAQLVNKKSGAFTRADERLFEAYAVFCGLGMMAVKAHDSTRRSEQRLKVTLDVLSYHCRASDIDTDALLAREVPSYEALKLGEFSLDTNLMSPDDMVLSIIRMFTHLGFMEHFRIPYTTFCRWLLTVRGSYRPVVYHNWAHAFSVTHAMFLLIHRSSLQTELPEMTKLALLMSCICHDLDHRGTNNDFQKISDSPLAQLYGTSTMEHHHFDQSLMLLMSEGNNFLANIPVEDFSTIVSLLEHCILSTDLALYMKKRDGFFAAVKDKSFGKEHNWHKDTKKMRLLTSMLMTASDIFAVARPWASQLEAAKVVYEEFYEQGDLERSLGKAPAALMDRQKIGDMPNMQMGFVDFICMPLYEALTILFPRLQPILDNVKYNRAQWESLKGSFPLSQKKKKKNGSSSSSSSGGGGGGGGGDGEPDSTMVAEVGGKAGKVTTEQGATTQDDKVGSGGGVTNASFFTGTGANSKRGVRIGNGDVSRARTCVLS